MNVLRFFLASALLMAATSVAALEFTQVRPAESRLTFAYEQMGVPMDGRFSGFSAQLNFDPAKLAKASARIDVDVASIDTGSAEADAEVIGKAWFDARRFPKVTFVSSGIRALGGNRYEASGKLNIKGKTREVVTPVTFQSSGNKGIFDGSFTIRRLDYAIGEGMWADVSAVADQVKINFRIVVHAASAK
jgi:polyisoprenoid-binding protein YceI